MIAKLRAEDVEVLDAKKSAEEEWKQMIDQMSKYTLIPYTDSWWNGESPLLLLFRCPTDIRVIGANIPGKRAECMIHVGGINMYEKQVREKMDGWQGFDVVAAAA